MVDVTAEVWLSLDWRMHSVALQRVAGTPEISMAAEILDYRSASGTRDAFSKEKPRQETLHRATREVVILLPPASPIGEYQVQIRPASDPDRSVAGFGASVITSTPAAAKLLARIDLSALSPGPYVLAFRRARPAGALWELGTFMLM